ncbi:pilus assembly protein [Lachnospiraceae bacterium ZAX-1]
MPLVCLKIKKIKSKNRKISLKKVKELFIIKNKKKQFNQVQEVRFNIFLSGSFTVEASFLLPLFLFASISILFFFRMLQVQQCVEEALCFAGAQTAAMAEDEKEGSLRAVAVGLFYKELAKQNVSSDYIVGGKLGITWEKTAVDGAYIDLFVRYKLKLPLHVWGIKFFTVVQRSKVHKWIGFSKDAENENTAEWVFVTPTATVYHRKRECTHLKLSVKCKLFSQLDSLESNYGACEICASNGYKPSIVYITDEGRRYHVKLDCSGIKRTIYMIKITEIGGKPPCTRCGG